MSCKLYIELGKAEQARQPLLLSSSRDAQGCANAASAATSMDGGRYAYRN
jgi:hypothetical protein